MGGSGKGVIAKRHGTSFGGDQNVKLTVTDMTVNILKTTQFYTSIYISIKLFQLKNKAVPVFNEYITET